MENTEQTTSPLESKEVQIAAGHYAQLSKSIRSYSKNMSGKGLARVVCAVADFPFANSYPKFRTETEKNLFTMLLSINQAKTVIANALKDDEASIKNEAVNGIVEEELTKLQGENNEER